MVGSKWDCTNTSHTHTHIRLNAGAPFKSRFLQGCCKNISAAFFSFFFFSLSPEVAYVTVRRSRRRQGSSVDLTLKSRAAIFLLAICRAHSRNRSLPRGVVGDCDVPAVWQVNSERGRRGRGKKKNHMNPGDGLLAVKKVGGLKGEGVWRVGEGGRVTEARGPERVKPPAIKNKSAVCFSYASVMALSY